MIVDSHLFVVTFPGVPIFILWFAFTVNVKAGQRIKVGKAWKYGWNFCFDDDQNTLSKHPAMVKYVVGLFSLHCLFCCPYAHAEECGRY